MSTRPDPWGSGAVEIAEIATQNVVIPDSVGLAQPRPLTKPPAMVRQPSARLGLGSVQPTHAGVGPPVAVSLDFMAKPPCSKI